MLILAQPGVSFPLSVCLPACLPTSCFFFFSIAAPFDVSPKCSVVSERLHAMECDEADRDNEVYITQRRRRQTNMHPAWEQEFCPASPADAQQAFRRAKCISGATQVTGR